MGSWAWYYRAQVRWPAHECLARHPSLRVTPCGAARRTAPCRRGPSSRLRRWRSRRSSLMPIDSVSTCGWCDRSARTVRAYGGRPGGGLRRPDAASGSPSGRAAAAAACAAIRLGQVPQPRPGRQPCLLASSSMLTWISTFSGARSAARCRARASARRSRSTVCTQSKRAAASRALFDCRWPIRCHSSAWPVRGRSASAACLAAAS